ncbi:MAG: hotdog domain-containing protein, partial [Candidatus Helarchaeota archaeon]
LTFTQPIQAGEIARFESKIVHTGRSSLVVSIQLKIQNRDKPVLTGFITFVQINEGGKAEPHGLVLELISPEEILLNQKARALK